MREKKRINEAFYNKLDQLYEQMHFDKNEKALLQFRTKIDRLSASENGEDLLRREADHLRKQSEEINSRLRTYDNNRGFFKASKGNNTFLQEIENKIQAEKSRMDELSARREMVLDAISRLHEPEKVS